MRRTIPGVRSRPIDRAGTELRRKAEGLLVAAIDVHRMLFRMAAVLRMSHQEVRQPVGSQSEERTPYLDIGG
jgi:hypothetical protein